VCHLDAGCPNARRGGPVGEMMASQVATETAGSAQSQGSISAVSRLLIHSMLKDQCFRECILCGPNV
jgi:hypothetical protein